MSALELFHPVIREWFLRRFGSPTEVQERSWPEISAGRHVLVTAPTGSGKTLTAFLWALDRFIRGALPRGGMRVLYISPLKALNNDMKQNLLSPLEELEGVFAGKGLEFPRLTVAVRSGDTPQAERRALLHHQPEIFITTPESLNILLTSIHGRRLFAGLTVVILDEIHALVSQKRGTHLITAVERLVPICGEFQRIALSATVRPLEVVAEFVGGYSMRSEDKTALYNKRPVTIIEVPQGKRYELAVCLAEEEGLEAVPRIQEQGPRAGENGEPGDTTRAPASTASQVMDSLAGRDADMVWDLHAAEFLKRISAHNSTLLFVNSRKTSERVAHLINQQAGGLVAYSHHGSLSREIRLAVEEKLKYGELKAIVATSSLELGIDIGELDQVILVQTPPSLSSAVQRIGRAGHKVGEVSRGLFYPLFGREFVLAAVAGRCIVRHEIEEVRPVTGALDILAQVILSMTAVETWDRDELYNFIRCSYPYHTLSRRQFELVLAMLAGRYADTPLRELKPRLSLDKLDNSLRAKKGAPLLLYLSGGTIPDRGYYNLRLGSGGEKIGELDEEFVWERNIGDTFAFGVQAWRIQRITHNDVEVAPADRGRGMIPFWRADPRNRDFYFSERILLFLRKADAELETAAFADYLQDECFMEQEAAGELIHYLTRQKQVLQTALPHRYHIVIEHYNDPFNTSGGKQVILHTFWGGRINRPFALALAQAWEEEYKYPLEVFADDDCILLNLPHDFHAEELLRLVPTDKLELLLKKKLPGSAYFGALFRENAGRALLLPRASFARRMPLWLNRLRAQKLLKAVSRYDDFPLVVETWRQCLQDEFDLSSLQMLLAEIGGGEITVSEAVTTVPSPFAGNIIWRQTNKYMYADDTPSADAVSSLAQDLYKEVVSSALLRPRIPPELIEELERKLQRTAPGYVPADARDMLDWVIERLVIPEKEWPALAGAFERDTGRSFGELHPELSLKLVLLCFPGAAERMVAAAENLPRITRGFGIPPQMLIVSLFSAPDSAAVGENAQKLFPAASPRPVELKAGRPAAAITSPPAEKSAHDAPIQETPGATELVEQFLAYYGPLDPRRLKSWFGFSDGVLAELIRGLRQNDVVLYEPLSEGARDPELCLTENVERLLRMYRRQRRPSFTALPIRHLVLFLARHQGVIGAGVKQADLEGVLEKLFGYVTPAAAWEEYIFPVRLKPYYPAWLDSIMQQSDLIWLGCGKERLTFCFPEDASLFGQARAGAAALLPSLKGRYSLSEIADHGMLDSLRATELVWKQTWQGALTNDTFEVVRRAVLNSFTPQRLQGPGSRSARHGYSRWRSTRALRGSWYAVAYEEQEEPDPVMGLELQRRRVRQVLSRYGIVFRELLLRESKPLRWPDLFRTLRLMELAGEVYSGYFFENIPGLQFASAEALHMLRQEFPLDAVYWLNAADPASPCGLGLDALTGTLPRRVATTSLVYHGVRLVLIVLRNGRALEIRVPPDHARLLEYYGVLNELVTREFNPLPAVKVEIVNGKAAARSPYKESLLEFGLREDYKALVLRKRYV